MEEKEEEEEKAFTEEHNEYVFNIYFECTSKQDNWSVTITAEREDEENDAGKDMEVSKYKEESIETIFQQWSQEEIRFFYEEIWQKEDDDYAGQEVE